MKCSEVRAALPGLLYEDLSPKEALAVNSHLTTCPACQREQVALERVRTALGSVANPAVQVNLPRLYQKVADQQTRRVRFWRRSALACLGVAASLLIMVLLGLEIHVQPNQLVVRWGSVAQEKPEPSPKTPPSDRQSIVRKQKRTFPDIEERLRVMTALIHALAKETEDRDAENKKYLTWLQTRLVELSQQASQHMSITDRNLAALYAAQLSKSKKGETP